MSWLTCSDYAHVRSHFAHEAMGAARHPAFPAPSSIFEGQTLGNTRARMRRGIAVMCLHGLRYEWLYPFILEERPTGPRVARPDDKLRRVSKDEATSRATWFETALTRLLTMRVLMH
jgi:hypothetical protein